MYANPNNFISVLSRLNTKKEDKKEDEAMTETQRLYNRFNQLKRAINYDNGKSPLLTDIIDQEDS